MLMRTRDGRPLLVPTGWMAWARSNGLTNIRPATADEEALHLDRVTDTLTLDRLLRAAREARQDESRRSTQEPPQDAPQPAKVEPKARRRKPPKRKVASLRLIQGGLKE